MMLVIIDTKTIITVIINICQGALLSKDESMRLTQEQARKNRQHILEVASRMFRLRGVAGVSVIDIMKESGFTHGGFYNHFNSKEELAAAAVACSFEKSANNLAEKFASGRN